MPMYTRGFVSYGTVIATLIATLGDAAFVLIGAALTDLFRGSRSCGTCHLLRDRSYMGLPNRWNEYHSTEPFGRIVT